MVNVLKVTHLYTCIHVYKMVTVVNFVMYYFATMKKHVQKTNHPSALRSFLLCLLKGDSPAFIKTALT